MSDATVIRKERTELYVGLFILFSLLIMGILIWQFGKFSDRLEPDYKVELMLQDASGIIPGGNVMFAGERIGYVKSRELDQEEFKGVALELRVFKSYEIPVGSRFRIATSGLMGDSYVAITPPSPEEMTLERLPQDGTAFVSGSESLLDQLPQQGKKIADKMEMLLAELEEAAEDVHEVAINFITISEKIDERVMSEENLAEFDLALEKIGQTTENLEIASAKLGPLIEESQRTVEAAALPFKRVDAAIAKLEPGLESLDPALRKLEPAMDELNRTLSDLRSTVNQVSGGEGVVPALLSDKGLRENLESLIANLEEYGILGYKKGKRKQDDASPDSSADSKPAGSPARKPLFGSADRVPAPSRGSDSGEKPPEKDGKPSAEPEKKGGFFQRAFKKSEETKPRGKAFGKS